MSTQQLYIPQTIKVGYQKRNDTYTGQLAYVIYYKGKKLCKETSWNSWRDKKCGEHEFENVPTEGFVLNKGVGGVRQSYGWNARNEYIRVYDPRNFEFEISVANLLFILRECDCSKGKGLEGKFVYAWDRGELILLPTISDDFKKSAEFTDLQSQKVGSKEMIIGATYLTKNQRQLIYLGRLDYYFVVEWMREWNDDSNAYALKAPSDKLSKGVVKRHVFWDGERFEYHDGLAKIGALHSDTVSPDYADLLDKYNKSEHGSKVVKLKLKKAPASKNRWDNYWFREVDGVYEMYYSHYTQKWLGAGLGHANDKLQYIRKQAEYTLDNGVFQKRHSDAVAYAPGAPLDRYAYGYSRSRTPVATTFVEPTNLGLFATTENGVEFRVQFDAFKRSK